MGEDDGGSDEMRSCTCVGALGRAIAASASAGDRVGEAQATFPHSNRSVFSRGCGVVCGHMLRVIGLDHRDSSITDMESPSHALAT